MRKVPFMCLIGIDGSGKTTLARSLCCNRGDYRYIWNSFDPRLIRPLVAAGKRVFFRGQDIFEDYHEYSVARRHVFSPGLIATGYENLYLLDYSMQVLPRVCCSLIRGGGLVCDRYVYDTVVDLAVDLGFSAERRRRLLRNLLRIFPQPDLVFLLDVPEEVALKRKTDHPLDLLTERREAYLHMARENGIIVLDGLRTPQELRGDVWQKVDASAHGC